MNTTFVLEGLCIIFGILVTGFLWKRSVSSKIARAFLLFAGAGIVVVGLAPADTHENIHVVLGALPIAVFGNIGLIITGKAIRKEFAGKLRYLGPVLGVAGVIGTYLFVSQNYLGLGPGGMERLWAYNFLLWTAVIGGYSLMKSRETPKPLPLAQDSQNV